MIVMWRTTPLVFEPGLIAYSESRASALSNSAKESDPLARSLQAGWIVTFLPFSMAPDTPLWQLAIFTRPERNMAISRLWVNYQCAGLYLGLRTSPQCNVADNPTGIRTWVDSLLRVASQRSNQFGQRVRPADEKLADRLDCHMIITHYSRHITQFYRRHFANVLFLRN